jgi:hypothetical protein
MTFLWRYSSIISSLWTLETDDRLTSGPSRFILKDVGNVDLERTLITRNEEALVSNLDRDTSQPDYGFHGFPPGKYRDKTSINRRPLSSNSFPIHHVSYHSTLRSLVTGRGDVDRNMYPPG